MKNELLKEKLKEFRVLTIGLVATLILAGVYFVRTGPIGQLKERHAVLRQEVDLLVANQRNGNGLSENLGTVKKYTSLMDDRFISQNLADIHDVFYTLEREAGVSLDSFQRPEMVSKPIKPKANEKIEYQPLSMAVTISGTFKNVLKFLHSLESSPLLYRYSGLKVSAKQRTTEKDQVSLTLNLELLSLNDL